MRGSQKEVEEAKNNGCNRRMDAFPVVKEYESDTLFAAFAGRLPDPKRRGIEDILKKYGLSEYDGYELLRKSTGRLPIDTYEFIDPIFHEDETVQRDFFLMKFQHNDRCEVDSCIIKEKLRIGEELQLVREPDNDYDPNAVIVTTKDGKKIGYIPKYYSDNIAARLDKDMSYLCTVLEVNANKECENCVKVRLKIPRE